MVSVTGTILVKSSHEVQYFHIISLEDKSDSAMIGASSFCMCRVAALFAWQNLLLW